MAACRSLQDLILQPTRDKLSAFNLFCVDTLKTIFYNVSLYPFFQEFNPDGSKIPSKNNTTPLLSPSSASGSTPQRQISKETHSDEDVQEINTPDTRLFHQPL